jgi:hypothetical protein
VHAGVVVREFPTVSSYRAGSISDLVSVLRVGFSFRFFFQNQSVFGIGFRNISISVSIFLLNQDFLNFSTRSSLQCLMGRL